MYISSCVSESKSILLNNTTILLCYLKISLLASAICHPQSSYCHPALSFCHLVISFWHLRYSKCCFQFTFCHIAVSFWKKEYLDPHPEYSYPSLNIPTPVRMFLPRSKQCILWKNMLIKSYYNSCL